MLTTILPQIIIAATATVTITSTLLYVTRLQNVTYPITQKEDQYPMETPQTKNQL